MMPQPLKSALLPLEQYLFPDLPTIVGNVDYQTLRAQLRRIHQLLVDRGIERDFIARSVSQRRQFAVKRYQKSGKYEKLVREHSARALRCNLARVLLKEDFCSSSVRLADSLLLQRFVGIARLDAVVVPSKSSLQRYEQWLPESEVRAVVERLLQLAAQPEGEALSQSLDLEEPLNLDIYFLDMSCVKANIPWLADWVLLKDAVQTLMAAVKQAHERIIGERPVKNADKILSFYEPDAHVIVRGKAGAEVEFGNTLVLGEVDGGVIVDWQLIREHAMADCHRVSPAWRGCRTCSRTECAPSPLTGIVTARTMSKASPSSGSRTASARKIRVR